MKHVLSKAAEADGPIPQGPPGPLPSVSWPSPTKTGARLLTLVALLFFPSFLSPPAYVWAIGTGVLGLSPEEEMPVSPPQLPDGWDPSLQAILSNEVQRHGVDNPEWLEHLDQFIHMVSHIESDHQALASNPSGAMSYFQFKPDSVKTAHYRLLNYMRRYDLGEIPRWSVGVYYHPERLYDLSFEQQTVLMITNLIELDYEQDTDYFAQFLQGDLHAGLEAYYTYHHTKPDQATIERTESLFASYFL